MFDDFSSLEHFEAPESQKSGTQSRKRSKSRCIFFLATLLVTSVTFVSMIFLQLIPGINSPTISWILVQIAQLVLMFVDWTSGTIHWSHAVSRLLELSQPPAQPEPFEKVANFSAFAELYSNEGTQGLLAVGVGVVAVAMARRNPGLT